MTLKHWTLLIGTFNDTTASASSYGFNGAVSNFRVIKGTALYTSRFTPPAAPLTNVTNTKLLFCQSNTSATESCCNSGSITANGDAAATTFNPFNTDINTVRGQETGYCTLNPIGKTKSEYFVQDGNLTSSGSSAPSGSSGSRGYSYHIQNRQMVLRVRNN